MSLRNLILQSQPKDSLNFKRLAYYQKGMNPFLSFLGRAAVIAGLAIAILSIFIAGDLASGTSVFYPTKEIRAFLAK